MATIESPSVTWSVTPFACDKSRSCRQKISSGPKVRRIQSFSSVFERKPRYFHAIERLEYDNTLERISSTDLVECELISDHFRAYTTSDIAIAA